MVFGSRAARIKFLFGIPHMRQERSKNAPATTGAVHLGNDQHLY
jgi:hypothetical protein